MKILTTLIALAAGAIWLAVAQSPSASSDMRASASFTPDPVVQHSLGTTTVERGVGGFGRVTFVSKDGKVHVTRPLYPPGHTLSQTEADEAQSFQWPAAMTPAMFNEMMAQAK